MTIFRNQKEDKFSQFENILIRNPKITAVEKTVLFCLLSLPKEAPIHESALLKFMLEGIYAIRKAIKGLVGLGYIHRKRIRAEDGSFKGGYEYDVYESPKKTFNVVQLGKKKADKQDKTNKQIEKKASK